MPFAAIRTGLAYARGKRIAVMAADLQEPPELVAQFFEALASGDYEVAVGRRVRRDDPLLGTVLSRTVWRLMRRVVNREIPPGGVDFFACVRHHESRGIYSVVNRGSGAAGAYQFMPTTWNNAARDAGRADLVGVNPSAASPADQDAIARYVYTTQGARPWAGSGCS